MTDFDLIIRGGTVLDGSGQAGFIADVAVRDGVIAEIGELNGTALIEIDAAGCIVTPGFVDIHTHYDGQATWENRLIPSSSHGVTTAVLGNCGVGFAPCKPDQHEQLIQLMEGVEDIPEPVLAQGLSWTWETYPEYLDLLASRSYDMNIAGYLPHAALRVYVMGQRGADRDPATPQDIARMCELLGQALDAGALGIATSRTIFHRSSDGTPIPTLEASDEELLAFARTLKEKGKGVFQIVGDFDNPDDHFNRLRKLAECSGRTVTFSMGTTNNEPYYWPKVLELLAQANADGLSIKAQVMPRAIGMMLGHELTLNPFYSTASYREIAHVPLQQRLELLRKPEVRERIINEPADPDPALTLGRVVRDFDYMFELGEPPNYEQSQDRSIAARARRKGISPEELAYDLMTVGEAGGTLYLAMANYAGGTLDAVGEMLSHPDVVPGLGDGGAHCGTICDGSYSTFMLSHWGRDREQGRLPLEQIVRDLSRSTAEIVGMYDRGLIATDMKADINVIDLDRLRIHKPEITYDLPGNGRRLVQRADGYVATIVDGKVVYRNGEHTGELPGRLVRSGADSAA